MHVEGRLGAIAVRNEPLGRGAQPGGDVYVGKQLGEFNIGLLYENKRTEPEYSGLMVQFRPVRSLGRSVRYLSTIRGDRKGLPFKYRSSISPQ